MKFFDIFIFFNVIKYFKCNKPSLIIPRYFLRVKCYALEILYKSLLPVILTMWSKTRFTRKLWLKPGQ